MYVSLQAIMDYGRHCLGIYDPDALASFVDVIQMTDAEFLER